MRLLVALLVLAACRPDPPRHVIEPTQPAGPEPVRAEPAHEEPPQVESAEPVSACNEQPPQAFLMRSTYMTEERVLERLRRLHAAIEYRTRRYGYVEGFGRPSWNRLEPKHYARDGTFFGIRVRMNVRVLTALGCVESAIRDACAATPYVPEVLDGLRKKNTFYDGEVSNHLYGVAIDIDPAKNACCGCIAKISDRPLCKQPASSPFERASIPKCWVDQFERFGFYWLGYDAIEDTMHFEFLGDPDKIATDTEMPPTSNRRAR